MTERSAASGTGRLAATGVDRPEGTTPSPVDPTGRLPHTGTARPRRARHLRSLLVGAVAAVGLAVYLFVGVGTKSAAPVAAVGTRAPDFTLPSVRGGAPVNLDALGVDRHRPVVLNFFASWCPPCVRETPLFARTARATAADHSPVQFVGVDVADAAGGAAFVAKAGTPYPVGADTTLAVFSRAYGLTGEPDTFFIAADGRILGRHLGALDAAELDHWVSVLANTAR